VCCRLVGQQQQGVVRQSTGDRDPLLLPAAEVPRLVRRAVRHVDPVEQLPRASLRSGAIGTRAPQRRGDVLQR
jgi:hypothetical protein